MGSFRKYGVDSLKDLKKLEGQFYVDGGFASTSLQEGMSYVGMEFDDPLRQKCDIEIRYLISGNEHEGVALLDRDVTCSPNRQEYLLNAYSLGYVSRVEIDEQNVAHMDMVLVPHRLYEE